MAACSPPPIASCYTQPIPTFNSGDAEAQLSPPHTDDTPTTSTTPASTLRQRRPWCYPPPPRPASNDAKHHHHDASTAGSRSLAFNDAELCRHQELRHHHPFAQHIRFALASKAHYPTQTLGTDGLNTHLPHVPSGHHFEARWTAGGRRSAGCRVSMSMRDPWRR
ncbi:hypothetical protein DFP72DRAFT_897589 [Ephemerocybe angulata]|uniref:Uncharacterized protein n=1 Tax=Ephemerocybe angulata TaxID=980116 RepID=A0A8H6HZF1_9AGAR|nr:hypothetical protein DFP72DRAFT_897589 [Tulosesus angulatus]